MRVQLDRFEDNGWAVVMLLPEGKRSLDVPMESLPEDASVGDVFDVNFERDDDETRRIASENGRLMEELLGRERREDA